MLKVAASVVAAAALALAAAGATAQPAPKATPAPFVLGTLQPLGSTPPPLPNIGRTRSVSAGCAALRDLVAPSFEAAKRADVRFAETRKRLPNYADLSDDPDHANDGLIKMTLAKLDSDVSALLQEAKVVADKLGDPRISAEIKDPQVMAERRALQRLYEAQMTRASMLSEFVIREQYATAKYGIGDNGGYTRTPAPMMTPLAELTPAPGMPRRTGNFLVDKNAYDDWGSALTTFVRTYEGYASKTVLPIARSCG